MFKYTTPPENFTVGEIYDNDQIHRWFETANSGGIRPAIDSKGNLRHLVIMSTKEEANYKFVNPYADKIEDEILIYTGQGNRGDQALSGANKRVVEQLDKSIPIVFFQKEARNNIRFIGFLLLIRHFEDYQLDSFRSVRKVQVFEFKIKKDIEPISRTNLQTSFNPVYQAFKLNKETDISLLIRKIELVDTSILVEREILRNKLLSINPYDFEELMADLVQHTGFTDVQVTKKSGDGGVDIKAKLEHHFSPEIEFLFQVKRWRHSVGRPDIANLRGSIGFNNFGVMISTSHFTKSAINEASADAKKPINLVGLDLLNTIISKTNYQLKI